jgi:hypothetical protein
MRKGSIHMLERLLMCGLAVVAAGPVTLRQAQGDIPGDGYRKKDDFPDGNCLF